MENNVWMKSTHSASNGACVEVMPGGWSVLVRQSKDPHGAFLAFTREEWKAFVEGVKGGEFDL